MVGKFSQLYPTVDWGGVVDVMASCQPPLILQDIVRNITVSEFSDGEVHVLFPEDAKLDWHASRLQFPAGVVVDEKIAGTTCILAAIGPAK